MLLRLAVLSLVICYAIPATETRLVLSRQCGLRLCCTTLVAARKFVALFSAMQLHFPIRKVDSRGLFTFRVGSDFLQTFAAENLLKCQASCLKLQKDSVSHGYLAT
jgi:hypothetical protein